MFPQVQYRMKIFFGLLFVVNVFIKAHFILFYSSTMIELYLCFCLSNFLSMGPTNIFVVFLGRLPLFSTVINTQFLPLTSSKTSLFNQLGLLPWQHVFWHIRKVYSFKIFFLKCVQISWTPFFMKYSFPRDSPEQAKVYPLEAQGKGFVDSLPYSIKNQKLSFLGRCAQDGMSS